MCVRLQEAFADKHGVKLGFMSAFIKAAAYALNEVPAVNAGQSQCAAQSAARRKGQAGGGGRTCVEWSGPTSAAGISAWGRWACRGGLGNALGVDWRGGWAERCLTAFAAAFVSARPRTRSD